MKNRPETRHLFVGCLVASVLPLIGCSYLTNCVVINLSEHPVDVRYRIKKPSDPRAPSRMPMMPGVKPVSEQDNDGPWRELSASEYTFDPDSRTVMVSLKPGETLRIAQLNQEKQYEASDFYIEVIDITGTTGEIRIQGQLVYKSFVPQSKKTYTLTYR